MDEDDDVNISALSGGGFPKSSNCEQGEPIFWSFCDNVIECPQYKMRVLETS